MKPISVLIVDDSAFMRKLIKDFLSEDPRITVLDTARNGQEAIEKTIRLKPDVVTMDVEMPVLNGIEAVRGIMNSYPVPIIMLSSTTKAGAENTILAMEAGAIDVIAKPSGAISLDLHKVKKLLIEKVIASSKAKITSLKGSCEKQDLKVKLEPIRSNNLSKLVLIGTSTGGPRALQEVITKLPADLHVPVVVVQHMPAGFTKSLANRLDSLSRVRVKEAEHKEPLENGTVYIAPGGYHLRLNEKMGRPIITLDKERPIGGHRPAVNVLFSSAAKLKNYQKIAVIMTGMGSDGTLGIIDLKESAETIVITEAEESCIVYGMPKAAVLTKKVDEVVHLESIAGTIQNYL
ncbi:protein-glutamate methylesterase/protein-glutamine glutaminase [Fictibacillus barbaricus]|uniref:Protein-glutamate methylesterase/protein-glutamine glutaminase n=1 Tax=Fictibacillus barbaricus TaxID=182136 RepID=A0ABS2ZCA7_9BACL|nr:chemotaxis response regulator protein-glutamate methylesterase [Fictibacillus barbaricus]MBN3545828.1 chemotaxis response regulator protein-glutamate methylesterase [Fictibacillus barbaricus]GGB56446.1 chemotaxis response regulator protein-glutamate methylesterase [Fictibacillus barbaricus]